ncbi:hypothetical protein PF003_g26766 [Phytophthora fragariae]|nr:hypothetical protein PF003_g26766 [Phytophthora fragariae]
MCVIFSSLLLCGVYCSSDQGTATEQENGTVSRGLRKSPRMVDETESSSLLLYFV